MDTGIDSASLGPGGGKADGQTEAAQRRAPAGFLRRARARMDPLDGAGDRRRSPDLRCDEVAAEWGPDRFARGAVEAWEIAAARVGSRAASLDRIDARR